MKKILIALLFLLANIEITFAATGYRTGDNVVIWGPVLLIAIIWSGYVVGAKLKERKKREAERIMNQRMQKIPHLSSRLKYEPQFFGWWSQHKPNIFIIIAY